MQNKKPFEIILHVGRVTSLRSWVAKKIMSRSNPYKWMFYFWLPFQLWRHVTRPTCNIIWNGLFFVLHSSEVIFAFLIKKSRQKEIEIAFFHSLGNLKGQTLDHFFYVLHIRHKFPYKLIPMSMSWLKYFRSYHSLGNLKGHTLDHFFYVLHTRHKFPYKLIPMSMSWLKYFWSYHWKQYKFI